jgi:curved DNA-binding protein CbpA
MEAAGVAARCQSAVHRPGPPGTLPNHHVIGASRARRLLRPVTGIEDVMPEASDAYRALQVDPSAEPSVIEAAFRALARLYHPDGSRPDAARMARINAAYRILRDPELRRQYDHTHASTLQPVRMAVDRGPTEERGPMSRRAATGDGSPVLDFGRYAGWRISDLARHDADYLRWLARHSSGLRYREAIARVLPREPDLNRRANSVA